MKIYYLRADVDDYNWLTLVNDEWRKLDMFDGRSLINDWTPSEVTVVKGRKRKWSDVTSLSAGIIILTEKSKAILEDLIKDSVEFLPLIFEGRNYYIINVIKMIDGLNKDKSEYRTFSDGRIMQVLKYEFNSDIVKGHHIFKISEFKRGSVYVSDEFKKRVEENNLMGFDLEELWDSEK